MASQPNAALLGGGPILLWQMPAYLNRVATAVPEHDVHAAFVHYAQGMLLKDRTRALFLRMSERSGIHHRYSDLHVAATTDPADVNAYDFYSHEAFPSTAARMRLFERFAPALARVALDRLALSAAELARVRHVVVTCCTGLYAPGLDFTIMDHLGLSTCVERTTIGFMGCYAAINGLRMARHLVRSEPESSVVLLNLELCTLHMQETQDLGEVLSFLVFGDGCAASLISAEPQGFELQGFETIQIPGTRELITWAVRDQGFDMLLSGQVPGSIGLAMVPLREKMTQGGAVELWAVHPGGRTVLDAVQEGLALPAEALACSRTVLSQFGNMSSATVMFVLQQLMQQAEPGQAGCAMAFGPGLTAETMRFRAV